MKEELFVITVASLACSTILLCLSKGYLRVTDGSKKERKKERKKKNSTSTSTSTRTEFIPIIAPQLNKKTPSTTG